MFKYKSFEKLLRQVHQNNNNYTNQVCAVFLIFLEILIFKKKNKLLNILQVVGAIYSFELELKCTV